MGGVTLRLPIGHDGHWGVNEEASKRFTELTGIKTVWENNPYDQVYDKTFLDLGSQSGTYDVLDLNFAWFGQFIATNGLLKLQPYVENPKFPPVDLKKFIPACLKPMQSGRRVIRSALAGRCDDFPLQPDPI